MTYTALEAAWAKYNKAARELAALRANIERFLARDPYTVDVALDEVSGWWVARTRIAEEPPPVLGVQVGCMAHEALSSLNHVTWALAVRKLGERAATRRRHSLDFPIFDDAPAFRRAKALEYVSKPAAKVIDELQPFHRAPQAHGRVQHPLLLVKELANADKHRVLASSYGSVQLSSLLSGHGLRYDTSAASGMEFERILPPKRKRRMLRSGTELARLRFARGNAAANVHVAELPSAEVVFQSDSWAGVNIFSVGSCVATVDRCLSRLSELFPRDPWPPTTHDPASPYEW